MSTIQNKKIVAKEYPLKDILSNNKWFIPESRWSCHAIRAIVD